MTRELLTAIIVVVTLTLIGLGVWAWRSRARRDRTPLVAPAEIPAEATITHVFDALYVATTAHQQPLERLAAPGLGFRSRATVTVTDRGVALDLTGQARLFLAADRIVDIDHSTVVIDRVVEKDGLARLTWTTDAASLVDSYLRPQDASARALIEAIRPLISHTRTGSDA